MGERAKIIINELTALEIIYRPDFNINNFYSSDYRIFINALLKENQKLKQGLEYAKRIEKCYKKKFDKAIDIAYQYGQIGGEHHKTWCIDQMVRTLLDRNYNDYIKEYENNGEYEWDIGIAP